MRPFIAVALLALAACGFDPIGPSMGPPAIYRQWYSDVEKCSGLTGDFDAIRWQHVYDLRDGQTMYRAYWYPRHTITLRDDFRFDEQVVKHEMMHDLIQSGEHPALYFEQVCGNLIGQ